MKAKGQSLVVFAIIIALVAVVVIVILALLGGGDSHKVGETLQVQYPTGYMDWELTQRDLFCTLDGYVTITAISGNVLEVEGERYDGISCSTKIMH